eukprot:scaffold34748_cov68-Phaeocystis_antarctica.AAC.6
MGVHAPASSGTFFTLSFFLPLKWPPCCRAACMALTRAGPARAPYCWRRKRGCLTPRTRVVGGWTKTQRT